MMQHALSTAAVLSAAGTAIAASPAAPSVADLQARVQELEARLAQVEAGDDWLTEHRAAEIRGIVHDVLADADTRASLQGNGAMAGWDDGFFLASSDGNFRLEVGGQIQVRWAYNHQDDGSDDSHRWGFENRRTKLSFEGHVIDPTWEYAIGGAFDRDGGTFELEDAYIKKDLGNGWYIRFGQFKLPFMFEELVSSKRQQFVERSLMNEAFDQDRSQGVEIGYTGEQLAFRAAYSDGFEMVNTPLLMRDTEFAFTGRVDFLAAGEWSQFRDFSSWRTDEGTGVQLGAAAHYQKDEYGTMADTGEVELFTWTGDVSIEFGGANLFGAIVGRHPDSDGADDSDQWGFVVQGGVFLTDDVEVFARYEWGDLDMADQDDLSVVTVGATKYWNKHALKWTSDVGYAFDAVTSGWDSSGHAWREDALEDDGQLVVRSQFQLLF